MTPRVEAVRQRVRQRDPHLGGQKLSDSEGLARWRRRAPIFQQETRDLLKVVSVAGDEDATDCQCRSSNAQVLRANANPLCA